MKGSQRLQILEHEKKIKVLVQLDLTRQQALEHLHEQKTRKASEKTKVSEQE